MNRFTLKKFGIAVAVMALFVSQSRADLSVADCELAQYNAQVEFNGCQNEIGCAYSWMFNYLGEYQTHQGRIDELRAKANQFILPWVNAPGWLGETATADYALVNARADAMGPAIDSFCYHYDMARMYRGINALPDPATYAWLAWNEAGYAMLASANVFLSTEKQEYYALAISYYGACWTFSHASSQFAMSAEYYANGFWESQMEAMDICNVWEAY